VQCSQFLQTTEYKHKLAETATHAERALLCLY